jgi:hypothetical protein
MTLQQSHQMKKHLLLSGQIFKADMMGEYLGQFNKMFDEEKEPKQFACCLLAENAFSGRRTTRLPISTPSPSTSS